MVIREDKVIRPDGAEGIYGVVEMPLSCGIVAIDDRDQIAMVSQWRYTLGKMSVEIPTGGAAHGEMPLDAAMRELSEETGLTASNWTPLGTIDNSNGVTTDVAHMFLARQLSSGPVNPQGDEDIELSWTSFADAVSSVMAGDHGVSERSSNTQNRTATAREPFSFPGSLTSPEHR